MSLLKSGDVRPLISDLKLTTVVYDGGSRRAQRRGATRYHQPAHLSREDGRHRGTLEGDANPSPRSRIHRAEFGFERQETLSLTKQEETP
jgi:hypothetical protein